ncbi:MAG: CDP-diacylglycerol--glycerol-3-phosphate 3-phosphatidyltransferase [Tenericutes bacterium ADurb.Bin024]|nr:MAG: CDP-diacylglycerol--glycerol-3-phosphate 3-phosphatidyltransferase [Tenericutes bacterium ADurb.Bin024]
MNLPNKLTTARMILVILLIIFMLIPPQWFSFEPMIIFTHVYLRYFIAAIVFLLAAITDYFDGYFARKLNLITNYGKFMDPIADKLLVNSMLIILAVPHNAFVWQISIPVIFVVLMIARDTIVDGFRLVAASQNKVLAANIFGKIKTVLQMIAIVMFLLNDWPFSSQAGGGSSFPFVSMIVMGAATLVSLLSGFIYIFQNISVLKETK